MKLFLVTFLFCCALTAHVSANSNFDYDIDFPSNHLISGRDGIFESIRKLIEKTIGDATNSLLQLLSKITNLKTKFRDSIQYIIDKALEQYHKALADIEQKIAALGEETALVKECVAKYKPMLEVYKQKNLEDLKECKDTALNIVSSVYEAIEKPLEDVKQNIKDLAGVALHCFNPLKPVSSFVCAVNETKQIADLIFGVIGSTTKALTEAARKTAEVTFDTSKCVTSVVEGSVVQTGLIFTQIKSCIADGKE